MFTESPFLLDQSALDWVNDTLATMTARQKIGQILCPYLRSDDMAEWIRYLDELELEPGAVMMLSRSAEAVSRDTAALQARSRVPLLIAGNLESGTVNFVSGTEAFANPMQVAASGDEDSVALLAQHCARAGNALGINWAFAPVVDIAMNLANPITNTRAFGSDPSVVSTFGARFVRELESRSIATSPKHFPGDGVDSRDQHLVTTSNDLNAETWWSTFGEVYRHVIHAGARTIMVGHIRQPALTRAALPEATLEQVMPATLAPELIQGILRQKLGFNGLVVSDNSAMTGLTSLMPRHEALPRMVMAGIDMVLGNLDLAEDAAILDEAVRTGAISSERLDEAASRVLATKASLGLHRSTDRSTAEQPAPEEERQWRDELARRSVTLVKDTQALLPLSRERHSRALVYVVGDEPTFYDPTPPLSGRFVDALRERGLEVEVRHVPGNTTTPLEAEHLHERFDVCLYFSALRFIGNSNVVRVQWSPWQGWDAPRHVASLPTALISIADPYQLQDMPMIKTAINGYTPTPSVVDAVVEVLFGEIEAVGMSPADPFVGHWDAAL